MRTVPFPSTPAQVRKCLSQASEGAIAVERNGEPKVVIMPAEEYARLIGLDQAGMGNDEIALADGDRRRLADLEAQAERVGGIYRPYPRPWRIAPR